MAQKKHHVRSSCHKGKISQCKNPVFLPQAPGSPPTQCLQV